MRISISIQDFLRKINSTLLSVFRLRTIAIFALFSALFFVYAVTILLVSLPDRHQVVYYPHHAVKPSESVQNSPFVASVSGKKYYETSCSFVKKIKEKNRVYFETEEEAQLSVRAKSLVCE